MIAAMMVATLTVSAQQATGTFSIIRTKQKITGTFRNSKGQTYKVNAVAYGGNWADE